MRNRITFKTRHYLEPETVKLLASNKNKTNKD